MSGWQAYIDTLKGYGNVSFGAIHGHNGQPWASSPQLKITDAEILHVVSGKDDNLFQGVFLGGEKYVFVRKDDYNFGWMIQLRKGSTGGATIAKTKQAVVIGIYGEKDQGGGCSDSVAKLAEYLVSSGY